MKYCVFDLDGTIVDSHSVYFTLLQEVFSHHNITMTEEDKKELLRISSKDRNSFFIRRLGEHNLVSANRLMREKMAQVHSNIQPFQGIVEVLQNLYEQEVKIALWTARERDSAENALELTNLAQYFSYLVSGSCVSRCKPDPEGLYKISRHFGCSPSELHMVGDHENDMNAARACGAIALRASWHNPEQVDTCTISNQQFHSIEVFQQWVSQKIKS